MGDRFHMRFRLTVPVAMFLVLAACSKQEVEHPVAAAKNAAGAASSKARDAFAADAPWDNKGEDKAQREKERYDQRWRQLQSFAQQQELRKQEELKKQQEAAKPPAGF